MSRVGTQNNEMKYKEWIQLRRIPRLIKYVIINQLILAQQCYSFVSLICSDVVPRSIWHCRAHIQIGLHDLHTKAQPLTLFTQSNIYWPHNSSFPSNTKGTLWSYVFATLSQPWYCCQNVPRTSLFNVATTLSTDVDKTLISNKLTTSKQPIIWRCNNFVTSLLGCTL